MNPGSSRERPVQRLRERLREATAEAILDAAEQVFAAEGPRARMESIATRAGIAVGTLYNHFADREALLDALSRSRREALLDRVDAALEAGAGQPFGAALRTFVAEFVDHWAAHRGFLNVLAQVEPSAARSPRAGARPRTMADELLARAGALVERGVRGGALRRDDAALFPAALLGTVRGVLLHAGDRAPGAAGVDAIVRLFLRGSAA